MKQYSSKSPGTFRHRISVPKESIQNRQHTAHLISLRWHRGLQPLEMGNTCGSAPAPESCWISTIFCPRKVPRKDQDCSVCPTRGLRLPCSSCRQLEVICALEGKSYRRGVGKRRIPSREVRKNSTSHRNLDGGWLTADFCSCKQCCKESFCKLEAVRKGNGKQSGETIQSDKEFKKSRVFGLEKQTLGIKHQLFSKKKPLCLQASIDFLSQETQK